MRTPLLLYGLALAVRAVLIWHFPYPAYPDSAYYVDVANAIHQGQGFNVDFIWIFAEVGGGIPANPVLPIPSNAHWMPLASIVQLPFLAVFGNVAWASAAPFALIGALAAPLTWAIARDAKASGTVAVGSRHPHRRSRCCPRSTSSSRTTSRCTSRSSSRRSGWRPGPCAAPAERSSRPDSSRASRPCRATTACSSWAASGSSSCSTGGGPGARPDPRPPAIPFAAAVACVGVFVLVMAPWWLRQLAVFGSLSPSSASGKVLFIRDIDEWNSISTPASLDHLLGMGIGPLLLSRIGGFVAAVSIYVTLVAGVVLAPLMVIGGWARRHSDDYRPFFVYAAILFAFSAIVSAVHVPGGTFIHSAVALAPYSYILALEGVALAVGWVAARRSAWNAASATRIFTGAIVGFAVVCAVVGTLVRPPGLGPAAGPWHRRRGRAG